MTTSTCSLCPLFIPQYLSPSWVLDICCNSERLADFMLKLPFLHIAGTIVGLILFINIRSFPLVWHYNVFGPFGIKRYNYYILSLCHIFFLRPSATRHSAVVSQLESRCPVGANPFEFTTTSRSWASPDETDWFGHVGNSAYAKARDLALTEFGVATWPTFVNAGGHFLLGSTHYHFLREIPRFARYEMTTSIGTWDHKWLYVLCRFTSRSPKPSFIKSNDPSMLGQLSTETMSSASDPGRSSDDGTSKAPLAFHSREKSDGTILHCVSVARLCFKMGRITVPPAIVLAGEGFSKPSKLGLYSHQSPPPHWVHPHALRNTSNSLGVYRRFLAGGWKDVLEGDRWWVEALSGPIEAHRRANLTKLEVIDSSMKEWFHP